MRAFVADQTPPASSTIAAEREEVAGFLPRVVELGKEVRTVVVGMMGVEVGGDGEEGLLRELDEEEEGERGGIKG